MSGGDEIRFDSRTAGLHRLRARFVGHAYDRHRHDSYAVGITDFGTQCFHYRGALRASQRGQIIVLHPDEVHDGHSGSENGFGYRMLYLDPALMAEALPAGASFPYVRDVVAHDSTIAALLVMAFEEFPASMHGLAADDLVASLVTALQRRSDNPGQPRQAAVSQRRVSLARAQFDDAPDEEIGSAALERLTGLTRFELARQFRAAYGTSPHRYLLGRRLAKARALILEGQPLADVAAQSGFADQSHMTRHFRAHFGMTPGRWAKLLSDRNIRGRASR